MKSSDFRYSAASILSANERLQSEIRNKARSLGFLSYEPIEIFWKSFESPNDEEDFDRLRCEEARELIGSYGDGFFASEDSRGITAYTSPLLHELRCRRDQRMGLPTLSRRPAGKFRDSDYLYSSTRRRAAAALSSDPAAAEALKLAWKMAYAKLAGEALQFFDPAVGVAPDLTLSKSLTQRIAKNVLSANGFSNDRCESVIGKRVFSKTKEGYEIQFWLDVYHPMQNKFAIRKSGEGQRDFSSRTNLLINLEDSVMVLLSNARPYYLPRNSAELCRGLNLYLIALNEVVDALSDRKGSSPQ